MATDQPDKEMTPGQASNILFIMSTNPNDLGAPFPNSRSIFVYHLPTKVDEEGNVNILKNGYWKPAGECIYCRDLGPRYFDCKRCDPLGFLYLAEEIELDQIEIVNDDPRSEGRMAHIVHLDMLNQSDPAAAREQFLFLFYNCGMDDPTFWDDENPITSMIVA
jgi:hypothetical protein